METIRGLLEVYIGEATGLPDTDSSWFSSSKDTTDAYVKVKLDGTKLVKTKVIENCVNPVWDQSYFIPINHIGDVLIVEVVDDDLLGSDAIGKATVDFKKLIEDGEFEDQLELKNDEDEERGTIHVKITFTKYTQEEYIVNYSQKIPACYYPMREGCKVMLYQDAECHVEEYHQSISNSAGEQYVAGCAWRDVHKAITEAEKFIYITGWSVFTEITLIREEGQPTLGEMLKAKVEEGVKVLMMVWNEKMSNDFMDGMMGTHDEDTLDYFADTDVHVVLAPRSSSKGVISNEFASTCYTHHQKSIIVDTPCDDEDGRKKILAFVGGLDLTNGRYDTPRHPLFSTLQAGGAHNADFYQNCTLNIRPECGPRQPWHDIHARVEGMVSQDVMNNFVDRWQKQGGDLEEELYPVCEEEFVMDEELYEGEDAWNVQFLRSITHDSCKFVSSRRSKLKLDKGHVVDDTIHRGYIHQIRRTKGFMYIENQYFLGSAHVWDEKNEDAQVPEKATHLIPIEIVRNITDAIQKGSHHCCYVVIPMFPEGDPTSAAVQEILYWQSQTMEMMYRRISKAIEEAGLDTHPTDYLSFYCLGKRGDDIPEELAEPEEDTEIHCRETKRHMIYVHSKMIICDDEYIIVGSANINQRSMGGRRDTEMAVGCYQPNFVFGDDGPPQGDVGAFRKSLWGEHLGSVPEECNNPQTIECMKKVNEMAQENWLAYISEEDEVPAGHLLSYPILVSQEGQVSPLEDEAYHCFPDTEAKVLGALSGIFPEKLTT